MPSPYEGLPVAQWERKTRQLITEHPIDPNEIFDVVCQSWDDIFNSAISKRGYKIGVDIFPNPQTIGAFLHEIIALEFASRYPGIWRRDESGAEKDLVYIPNPIYSIEIKTSSSPKSIFGNRSYAQETDSPKKAKSGYYLAVNFGKFAVRGQINQKPTLSLVRFGWLDHTDWIGQSAATGQQARLDPSVERFKLLKLPLE